MHSRYLVWLQTSQRIFDDSFIMFFCNTHEFLLSFTVFTTHKKYKIIQTLLLVRKLNVIRQNLRYMYTQQYIFYVMVSVYLNVNSFDKRCKIIVFNSARKLIF